MYLLRLERSRRDGGESLPPLSPLCRLGKKLPKSRGVDVDVT